MHTIRSPYSSELFQMVYLPISSDNMIHGLAARFLLRPNGFRVYLGKISG